MKEVIEDLAKKMHDTYERLAPKHGWETQKKSQVAWEDLPESNRSLMLAVIGEVFTQEALTRMMKAAMESVIAKQARSETLKKVVNELRGFFVSPGSNPGKRLMEYVEQWEKQASS